MADTPANKQHVTTPTQGSSPPDETAFLAKYDVTQFDRPSVAVDIVLLTAREDGLHIELTRRAEHPHKGRWALPGGFVRVDESVDDAAARVLREKAGLRDVFIEQLFTFGAVKRDPRTRVISVAYYALVDASTFAERRAGASLDLTQACVRVSWEGEVGGPVDVIADDGATLRIAFDHAEMIALAIKRLRGKLNYSPIGFQLLPERFTLRRLQQVHEIILGTTLNKDAFRRRMLATGLLEATGEHEQQVGHRPAELYRFTQQSAV